MDCFVDYKITSEEFDNLINLGLFPIKIPKCPLVYEAIDGHVDIQLNIVNMKERLVIVHNSMPEEFLNELNKRHINYIQSLLPLNNTYPANIILNGLVLDDYFVHNIKFTDTFFLNSQSHKNIVNVSQGYTKCSILPINDRAIITSDIKIKEELSKRGFDVLLLPFGDIILPPFEYGFIGGVGGMISKDTLAVFGDLNEYLYGSEILKFLDKYNVNVVSLKQGKLFDRGSLICI